MSSHDLLLLAGEVGRDALLHVLYGLGSDGSHRSHIGPSNLCRHVQQRLALGMER